MFIISVFQSTVIIFQTFKDTKYSFSQKDKLGKGKHNTLTLRIMRTHLFVLFNVLVS